MKKSLFALFTLIAAGVMALIVADMMRGAEAVPRAVPQAAVQQASLLDASTSNIDPDLAHVYEAKAAGTLDPNDPAYVRVLQRAVRDFEGRGGHSLDQGSDTCAATVIAAIPYFDSGTTAGRVDNFSGSCVGAGAPDVIYRFTPSITQIYSISLCGSSYDTGLIIKTGGACPGSTEVACNDDACGAASEVNVTLTSGVTYWIIVDGYTGQSGAYVLNVTGPPAACVVTCPGGGIPEGEACPAGTDHFNGGCNSSPPVFSPISCGQTVCGQCNTASGIRDTDWYSFLLSSPSTITWTVRASFNVSGFILTGTCPTTVITANSALTCSTLVLTTAVMPAGTYYVFVAPADFNTLACGNYVATLTCGSGIPGDNCASIINIPSLPYSTTGTTVGAADDYHCGGNTSPDVIFSLTAPDSGTYVISLCGSEYNTRLEVRTGGACPGSVQLACEGSTCVSDTSLALLPQSEVLAYLSAGTQYFIIVDGLGAGDAGTYRLNVSILPPPPPPCAVPSGACRMTPVQSQWGTGVAVDGSGNVYYTQLRTTPYVIYEVPSADVVLPASCTTAGGSVSVRPQNMYTTYEVGTAHPVRIEEMTWDWVHHVMWGASRCVPADVHMIAGRLARTRIYTITFNNNYAYCTYQFDGDGVYSGPPGTNWPTDGLTYDADPAPDGSIWQHLNFQNNYTQWVLSGNGTPTHPFRFPPNSPIHQTVTPAVPNIFSGICVAPNNNMYVAEKETGGIYLVDKGTGLLQSIIVPTTTSPCNRHGIACDPINFAPDVRLWATERVSIGGYPRCDLVAYPVTGPCACNCGVVGCWDLGLPYDTENEPCPADLNGGCNSSPPVFQNQPCYFSGWSICGTSWAHAGTRDTDWYTRYVTPWNGHIHWSVKAEFPASLYVIRPTTLPCGSPLTLVAQAATSGCGQTATINLYLCGQPATYYFFIAPTAFNGIGCSQYVSRMRCQPCWWHDLVISLSSASSVRLNWPADPDSSALTFNVYRSLTSDVPTIPANLIATTMDTTYLDSGIVSQPALRYFYTITVLDSDTTSFVTDVEGTVGPADGTPIVVPPEWISNVQQAADPVPPMRHE